MLRLVLELDGERVLRCVPHIGYLHTGIEKLSEVHNYTQNITHYPRMDYLAPMNSELAYCLAVEKLIGGEIPARLEAQLELLMRKWSKTHNVFESDAVLRALSVEYSRFFVRLAEERQKKK